jgi:hypothetical protein
MHPGTGWSAQGTARLLMVSFDTSMYSAAPLKESHFIMWRGSIGSLHDFS